MAIYHATLKSFSRGKGESSVAAAAYRAGFDLVDNATGLYHRYSHRHGVAHHQMLAPMGAPSWCCDLQRFWDANEAAETRANARVCREVEVALPHSLSDAQRKALALDLGQLMVDRYQVTVLVAIHVPSQEGDQRNHHVHLLMSARKVDAKGLGERAGMAFDSWQGGGAKAIRELRKAIEGVVNAHLERAGGTDRVDHRTLRAQAREAALKQDFARAKELSRPPTKHMGKTRTAMMRQAKKMGVDHALTTGSFVERVIKSTLANRRPNAWRAQGALPPICAGGSCARTGGATEGDARQRKHRWHSETDRFTYHAHSCASGDNAADQPGDASGAGDWSRR
jgi:hypothetical protein